MTENDERPQPLARDAGRAHGADGVVRMTSGGDAAPPWLAGAVTRGGGKLVPAQEAECAVWLGTDPDELKSWLLTHPAVRWIQLVHAGIEVYRPALDHEHLWTCAKGAFSDAVAEHGVALALAILRNINLAASATSWRRVENRTLIGANVLVVGGGGIAESLVNFLKPFRARCTVLRRSAIEVSGAVQTLAPDELMNELPLADIVFLALALTPETRGTIGAAQLAVMKPSAVLVNLARGPHVVTEDLVQALNDGRILGAGLDVTDPEPLPDGHPLWKAKSCLITCHSANSKELYAAALTRRVEENVRRFRAGEDLEGVVNAALGY